MEMYAYYSIIFFSAVILSLYLYILSAKIMDIFSNKRRKKSSKQLLPYVDELIKNIVDGKKVSEVTIENLKKSMENKVKREIIVEHIMYYFEIFKGDFMDDLIDICEKTGIVDYEIKNLKNKNIYKKALACKRLGDIRSRKSITPLLAEVNIMDNDVKYNVLLALAKIGDEEAFIGAFERINTAVLLSERSLIEIVDSFEGNKRHIYEHMINSKNDFIASVFIKSAGNFKDIFLSEEISKFLLDKDKEKRISAIKALGNMVDIRYLEKIIELLEDPEWEVRAIAAKSLGRFEDDRILIPLAKALSDKQWHVRYNAASSILSAPEGLDIVYYVFEGEDRFAKDIIASAIENSGYLRKIHEYEFSEDEHKKRIAELIRNYIEENTKGEKI